MDKDPITCLKVFDYQKDGERKVESYKLMAGMENCRIYVMILST